MQPVYFASFLLGENAASTPTVAAALEQIANWIFDNPRRTLLRPAGWPADKSGAVEFPSGEKIDLLRLIEDHETTAVAIRFEHPDPQGRHWRTDCVISAEGSGVEPALRFAVSVGAGSSIEHISPVSPPQSRPRIVRQMIEQFGARDSHPITSKFVWVERQDSERFVKFLLDPARSIPIVFLSRRNRDDEILCDPAQLADKLSGIAYICVAKETNVTWDISKYLDNQLNAYDGTVRLYWPRMRADDPAYKHRFWSSQRLAAMDLHSRSISDDLLRLIAGASVTRRISGLVRWEDLERALTKQTIKQLMHDGTKAKDIPEDWLQQYELDIEALKETKQALSDTTELLREREDEVRQWKTMYLQLQRDSANDQSNVQNDELVIDDATSALMVAKKDFAGKVEILENRIEKEARLFDEPELLYGAIKWLATTYRDAKNGTNRCPDLDKSCREACQFKYSGHQSDITMGMYATDYEVPFNGARKKLKEHIGYGTSTDPRRTIRLAFFYDDATTKVVIGFIGQHQSTRKSN